VFIVQIDLHLPQYTGNIAHRASAIDYERHVVFYTFCHLCWAIHRDWIQRTIKDFTYLI